VHHFGGGPDRHLDPGHDFWILYHWQIGETATETAEPNMLRPPGEQHTASQRHHTTVGVTFALPYLDSSLFHARRRTTVIAASLLAVRLYGTVCQLHFD